MVRIRSASAGLCQPPRTPALTLTRERNGWCVDSARLWLALEIKGVPYETVREIASSAPALTIGNLTFSDSLDALRRLDAATPDAPQLWPPPGVAASAVDEMTEAFALAMPRSRQSTRAAFLFCREEGSRYDALPRETFEATLDETERLLSRHTGGPFLCGSELSAADVAWAPMLERYAVQLPCLHVGLRPRGGRWRRLTSWFEAMDGVPAYSCRVRGDAHSWCKVLSSSPWWPAGWPPRGDPDERGDPRGGALALTVEAAADVFGGPSRSELPRLWASYAAGRDSVAGSPCAEAAAALLRNADALLADARACHALSTDATTAAYETALHGLIEVLRARGEQGANGSTDALGNCEADDAFDMDPDVKALVAYLEDRMCVPRDWGAPVAAVIRGLHVRHGDAAAPDETRRVVRVNNF